MTEKLLESKEQTQASYPAINLLSGEESASVKPREVVLKTLPEHKAEAIKELCYEKITRLGIDDDVVGDTFAQRREMLLDVRSKCEEGIKNLQKAMEEKTLENPEVLVRLNVIMSVAQVIDNNNISFTMGLCKKYPDAFLLMIGTPTVTFRLTYEGEDVKVVCNFYEDIAMNDTLLAQYMNAESTEEQVKILKEHITFSDVVLLPPNDNAGENPVFVNINPIIKIDDVAVDK